MANPLRYHFDASREFDAGASLLFDVDCVWCQNTCISGYSIMGLAFWDSGRVIDRCMDTKQECLRVVICGVRDGSFHT